MENWWFTWMEWWSLWKARQREQSGPSMQSKQYILHSLLCESACFLHCTKNLSLSRGLSHGGNCKLLSSSSGPPAPCFNEFQNRASEKQNRVNAIPLNKSNNTQKNESNEEGIKWVYHDSTILGIHFECRSILIADSQVWNEEQRLMENAGKGGGR